MKAMVLAAGEGTRLRPLTRDMPKPMLPIAGRPAIEHILAWLRHYGVHSVGINLCHRPQAVIDRLGDGARLGVEIAYSVEEAIIGTAGGTKRLAPFLDETFVLVYGDVLTDLDLGDLMAFHRSRPERPCLTLALYRVPNPTECGLVDLGDAGRVLRFVEKPPPEQVFTDLANAGIMVVDPEALEWVPEGQFYDFGHDLLPRLLAADWPVYGWEIDEGDYLLDFGTKETYRRVQVEWPTARAQAFLATP